MSSITRDVATVNNRTGFFCTVVNTAWLYPRSNIEAALATTANKHTFDGTNIVAANVGVLEAIAVDIYNNTAAELSPGGFSLGVGTFLQDMGDVLEFKLPSGLVFLRWRLARSMTDQATLPSGGAAPLGTVGFLPTFVAPGNVVGAGFDPVRCVRTG